MKNKSYKVMKMLTVNIEHDTFRHGGRHVVRSDAEVRAHLPPLHLRQVQVWAHEHVH